MKITIAEYNPDWPAMFQQEKQQLTDIIDQYLQSIEHIGSTAVAGLAGKPIIDIMAGLKNFQLADIIVLKLIEQGYQY
ncbi:MAG TPA: GrpB family protein, partial [Sedimentisphaerales bacterium]|nr:GrpB family protein [Sedimentisphaerales bacterium]